MYNVICMVFASDSEVKHRHNGKNNILSFSIHLKTGLKGTQVNAYTSICFIFKVALHIFTAYLS